MNKTGAKRLMILARHHMKFREPKNMSRWPEAPTIGWDMRSWYNTDSDHPCGTTCCSLGHACTIPELRDAGLVMSMDAEEPRFMDYDWAEGSAAAFFDLTEDEACHLFVPVNPVTDGILERTPKEQAAEIVKLVQKYHPKEKL